MALKEGRSSFLKKRNKKFLALGTRLWQQSGAKG
jgi:hypothetical protein